MLYIVSQYRKRMGEERYSEIEGKKERESQGDVNMYTDALQLGSTY